jgi:hypothetical protein
MKRLVVIGTILALLFTGCAKAPLSPATGASMRDVAITAATIGPQLVGVYQTLLDARALPNYDHIVYPALRILDEVAPMVAAQGTAIAGGDFNWAALAVQAAFTTVRIMGLW